MTRFWPSASRHHFFGGMYDDILDLCSEVIFGYRILVTIVFKMLVSQEFGSQLLVTPFLGDVLYVTR